MRIKTFMAIVLILLVAGLGMAWPALSRAQAPAPPVIGSSPVPMNPPDELPDPVGKKLMELKHYGEAEQYYRGVLAKDPDSSEACAGLGAALCNQGKMDQALAALSACIKKAPRQPDLYAERGRCYFLGPDNLLPRAEDDYRKALELDPDNAAAHNELGLLYQRKGRHEQAVTEFKAAIAADPDLFVAYNNLGASLIATKQFNEAITVLQQAIAIKPELKGYYIYQNLGIAFLYAGKLPEAEASFLLEVALNPDYAEGHVNLGNVYLLTGRYDDAIYEFYTVLVSEPANRMALINIGIAYLNSGNPMNAGKYLKKAVTLYPDSALAHHFLGLVYQSLGDQALAAQEEAQAKKQGYNPGASTWPMKPPEK